MDFNSPLFLFLFLPVAMLAYLLASGRSRLVAGILASLLFYAWGDLAHLPLMAGMILANYFIGIKVDESRGQKKALALAWVGVLLNVGILVWFKSRTSIFPPLGLSYIAFQLIAYLLEIYQRPGNRAPDLLQFSFYVLIFPKLVVGPIARFSTLKTQIADPQLSLPAMADGARRFLRGLAQKVLIADMLARMVDPIFKMKQPDILPWWAWIVLVSYAIQLYFDFSGYTNMALGLGQMMGLKLPENFNYPYISKSIGEFWRRWHMTLSGWFRDFVFYPLERRRIRVIGQWLNILVVFLLTGLWHGFQRTFIAWGLLHGLALVFESTWAGKKLRQAWAPIQHIYAMAVILAGWVFFRSDSLEYALGFFARLFGNTAGIAPIPFMDSAPLPMLEPSIMLALGAGILFSMPVTGWVGRILSPMAAKNAWVGLTFQVIYDAGLLFLLVASIAATSSGNFAPGIYGNF
jgi:alginate O-acetyltransferase complex protein AlgI